MNVNVDLDEVYSQSYVEARTRFLTAAHAAGAQVESYALSQSAPDLNIDVATLGTNDAPTLLLSSGVHGVEGFFGSAVQLALLKQLAQVKTPLALRYVLIHAVNPYGFKHLRRVNEDNIDLNRNFLFHTSDYQGSPPGYARLDPFLNPASRPTRLEPFRLRAAWNIWRMGLDTLKAAVAGGQYEFARGLFYGGKGLSVAGQIVRQHCDQWLGNAQHVLQVDLHTGLGTFAMPTLLLNEGVDATRHDWYARTFGADVVEPLTRPQGTAYKASGVFGQWMQHHFAKRDYRYVGAEFGTYPIVQVLAAIRAENRAHHYCPANDPALQRSKLALLECFCPHSRAWRRQTLDSALYLIERASTALRLRFDEPMMNAQNL